MNTLALSGDSEAARTFCARFQDTIEALRAVIEEETRALRALDIAGAEAIQDEKSRLAEIYLHALTEARSPEGPLTGLAPETVETLRRQHDRLRASLLANEDVLGALRSASQSLIQAAAEQVARRDKPSTYSAAGAVAQASAAAAVAIDRQL